MLILFVCGVFFFFKQKTAYEMRISDWSSDVCSSDLNPAAANPSAIGPAWPATAATRRCGHYRHCASEAWKPGFPAASRADRSEEHTSELQSLMRISYAVFCLKKKKNIITTQYTDNNVENTIRQHTREINVSIERT